MNGAVCYTQTFDQAFAPTYQWSVVSAAGTVDFDDAAALRPNVTFEGPGDYVLKLTATDVAIEKLDRRITAKEDEVNKVDKQIEQTYRLAREGRKKGLKGKAESLQKKAKGFEKKAEDIMDYLKTLRAKRRILERRRDAR